MPRNGIALSYSNSICSFLRNLHTVLHSGCASLHFYQHWRNSLFSPHPLQHLSSGDFWMVAILTDMRWYSLQFWIAFLLWLEIWTTLLCHHCLNCVIRTFWSIQQKAGLFQCKATEDSDTLLSFLFMTKYGLSVNILVIQVFHTTWSFTNHNGKQHEPL